MYPMARGWGGRALRAAVAGALTLLGVLVFSISAFGAADPPPLPKPDPPPKAPPPPPAVSRPPAPQPVVPPAAQPAAPPAIAPVAAPQVVHPTAAERRAEAAHRAKRKAARAARASRVAEQKLAVAHRRERAQALLIAANDTPSSSRRMPFLLVAFSAAVLLLGLAGTPARAVPWSRASRVLEDRRDDLGVVGGMVLFASVFFLLLVQVMK